MSTIDSKDLIDKIIAGNGVYPGDEDLPPIVKIVEYTNKWGGQACGVIREGQNRDTYHASEFVIKPKTLWER